MGYFAAAQSVPATTSGAAKSDADIRKATEALVSKYSLNADQAKQVYTILQRKERNMAEISAFQTSDMALYLAKWANVQKGTWASLRRVLNTREQVEIYQKTQSDIRGQRSAKRKQLAAEKNSKDNIEAAILAIYAE